MKAFTYERAKTPADAAAAIERDPNAKFIAGGTNLLDLMKLQIETPRHLIDVNKLELYQENKYYLIDLLRGRFDYPSLKARAIDYARAQHANRILVEDAGVGTALITELKQEGLNTIGVKPEHDKKTRMFIQTAKFESGQVFFPVSASWLPELEAELLTFPHSRHDDQVDSISQALGHEISTYDVGVIAE